MRCLKPFGAKKGFCPDCGRASGPLAQAYRPEKGGVRRKWMSQWPTPPSGPLARAYRPEKVSLRRK